MSLVDILIISILIVIIIGFILQTNNISNDRTKFCEENTPIKMKLITWMNSGKICIYESLPNLPYKKCTIIFEESKYHGMQEVSRECTG